MEVESWSRWPVEQGPRDSRRWGPQFWRFLHVYAAFASEWNDATEICIGSILNTLPCTVCATHAKEFRTKVPFRAGGKSPSEWVLELHNRVSSIHAQDLSMPWTMEHLKAAVVSWLQITTEYARVRQRLDVIEQILAGEADASVERPKAISMMCSAQPRAAKKSGTTGVPSDNKHLGGLHRNVRPTFYALCCRHDVQLSQLMENKKRRLEQFRILWKCLRANETAHNWADWPYINIRLHSDLQTSSTRMNPRHTT